jgi:hypothetical protein
LTYYKNQYAGEPVLIVTSVFNAGEYGFISTADNFNEDIINFLEDPDCMNEDSESFAEYETICFNSIFPSTSTPSLFKN